MVRPSLTTVLVVVLVSVLGFMAVAMARRAQSRSEQQDQQAQQQPRTAAPAVPQTDPLQTLTEVERNTTAPAPPKEYRVLKVRAGRTVELRSKPGGGVAASVTGETEFGSPTTLAVAAEKAGWLGVTSTELPNGQLAWVKARKGDFDERRTRLALRADLSERTVKLMNGKRVLHTTKVAIGRPGADTPTGRFAVTDKIAGSRYGAYYGCCILALSGKQPNLPPGWTGGDRLAIHGTDDLGSIGQRSSAGCLRGRDEDLQVLMRRVPLGTPVFIRA
jgi:lipoprotein-anchoring transpeptidase ErfK/SrfK